MTTRALLDYAAFQLVWLACAIGAAKGSNIPGVAAALVLIAISFYASRARANDVAVVIASGIVGFTGESVLATTGLIQYGAAWPSGSLAPAWIVALWMAFATTLPMTRWMLGTKAHIKSAVLGAIFGPAAYAAGHRVGALEMATPLWQGLVATAVIWALAFPLLIAFSARKTEVGK